MSERCSSIGEVRQQPVEHPRTRPAVHDHAAGRIELSLKSRLGELPRKDRTRPTALRQSAMRPSRTPASPANIAYLVYRVSVRAVMRMCAVRQVVGGGWFG